MAQKKQAIIRRSGTAEAHFLELVKKAEANPELKKVTPEMEAEYKKLLADLNRGR